MRTGGGVGSRAWEAVQLSSLLYTPASHSQRDMGRVGKGTHFFRFGPLGLLGGDASGLHSGLLQFDLEGEGGNRKCINGNAA